MSPVPSPRTRSVLLGLLPVLLGVFAFVLVTGGNMLAPGNVLWLQHSDLAQSYLGWAFYRHDPWGWPWGANPSYGLEFHSSVYYSDSVPLLAMLLKPVAGLLPEPFQYFGLWICLCFMLQGWFAWRLSSLASDSVPARLLCCVFFLLAPPLLTRQLGHVALVGQWPILAALSLYLQPLRRQRAAWTVLVAISMLIHAYIFLMVAAVWLADLVRRASLARVAGAPALRPFLRELAQVVLVTGLVAWMAGFFMVSGGGMAATGFGYYKMNLLAPFNGGGWSGFGLQMPQAEGEYEGFNYLGVGGLLLCLMAIGARWKAGRDGRVVPLAWPLVAVTVALTLVALTPHLGVGSWQGTLPLPAWLERKLSHSSIQSTGRLFWVPYYALLAWSFATLARVLPRRALVATLLVLVALQVADLRPGLENLRHTLVQRTLVDDAPHLQGPFWDAAGQRYRRLRLLMTQGREPRWEVLTRYALEHRMSTDAGQLARIDWKLFNRTRKTQFDRLAEGRPEEDTLYVLDPAEAEVASHAAGDQDAVFRLDGWNVLAPGWGTTLPAGALDLKPHAGK